MIIDLVSYRYGRDEIEALRLLLKINPLPGLEPFALDEDAYRRAFKRLCDHHLAMDAGEQALVDPLTALLMRQASAGEIMLRISSQPRRTILYRAPKFWLILDCANGACIFTPLQNPEAAAEPLQQAIQRHSAPAQIRTGAETIAAGALEDAQAALEKLLAQITTANRR